MERIERIISAIENIKKKLGKKPQKFETEEEKILSESIKFLEGDTLGESLDLPPAEEPKTKKD